SERTAHSVEMPGDAGFVFAEQAADFGKGFIFPVVEAEALGVSRIERGESGLQGAAEHSQITLAMRIDRGNGERRTALDGSRRLAVFEIGESARRADAIDVPLREHGSKPGFERASSVKIAEE